MRNNPIRAGLPSACNYSNVVLNANIFVINHGKNTFTFSTLIWFTNWRKATASLDSVFLVARIRATILFSSATTGATIDLERRPLVMILMTYKP